MADIAVDVADSTKTEQLADEVRRLRRELTTSRITSARALARATRVAQLVSALGQLTDVSDIFDRAVCEVAEQFAADIAMVVVPTGTPDGCLRVAAQYGLAARHVPAGAVARPPDTNRLTRVFPVAAGPVGEFTPPPWLLSSRPQHLVWGLLTAREEDIGYLVLVRRADEPFEQTDVRELVAVVSRIALAVDNGRLYRRTQEQLHRFRRLHEVTAVLAGIVEPDRAAQLIAETLVADAPVAGAAVYLAGDRGLELAGYAGQSGAAPQRLVEAEWTDRADSTLLRLRTGASDLGALLLTGAPAPGSDARSFLDHLADIGSLVLEKALLFGRVRSQAESDALTGLPNRHLLMEQLASAVARCRQAGHDLALIFVDLDGFKAVNDTYGHTAGDQVLVQAGRRLVAALRHADTVARFGGDEFVALCENVTIDEAHVIAGRLQRSLAEPYLLDWRSGRVEVSIGGSVGTEMASIVRYDTAKLLRHADAAMYAVKQRRSSTT